jgi:hypothetical protein
VVVVIVKKRVSDLAGHLQGLDSRVALGGGYLYIYLHGALIHIAGIPSPYLLAERSSDTTVENRDEFSDADGHLFGIAIYSSITGIEWSLVHYPDDDQLILGLTYEVKLNGN